MPAGAGLRLIEPREHHIHSVGDGTQLIAVSEQGVVGVAELLAGFPSPNEWYIGLLLLRPNARSAGAGTIVWEDLRTMLKIEGATAVRLIVQKQNPRARRFWERQGFAVEKEVAAKVGKLESQTWQLRLSFEA